MDADEKFEPIFSPPARYMGWVYLNSVTNVSYRYRDNGIVIDKVELGNRYWGIRGCYIKQN